jgi:hypothetical protein
MTLHEIESTLATLSSRHAGLDEGMLVTLLLAGGWDAKDIEEAKLLFRGQRSVDTETDSLPALPEHPEPILLEPEIGPDHELLEHNPLPSHEERVSLLKESDTAFKEEFPHNLPLRPFETSEHIWPFSRYRDVFYGDVLDSGPPPEKIVKVHVEEPPIPQPTPEVIKVSAPEPIQVAPAPVEPEKIQPISFRPDSIPKKSQTVSSSKGEDKLVMTATIMLFAILLLLGYMYSNGRL